MVSQQHITSESVRSYLLGTLEERDAAWVEERYFTNRAFFLLVQKIETVLIEDYLAGRLPPAVKDRFEARYLRVPDLQRRVEEVRRVHLPATEPRQRRSTWFLVAAALVLLCLGGMFWLQRDRAAPKSSAVPTAVRPILATLSLSPGLTKGDGAGTAQLNLPSAPGYVRVLLELPGRQTPVMCSAKVSVALSSGFDPIWSTPQPVMSSLSGGTQRIVLTIDSSRLRNGDYMIELVSPDERTHESYSFRVSRL